MSFIGTFLSHARPSVSSNFGVRITQNRKSMTSITHIWGEERLVGDEVVKMPCTSTKYDTLEWEQRLDIARTWFKNTFDYDIPYPSHQFEFDY